MHLHIKLMSFILAVLVNLSWAEVTPTLNSDAIKATFGSYGVEVISQSESTRVANLYSLSGNAKICRTLAVTEFVLPMDPALKQAHRVIRSGGSIGATLRSAGFTINKKLLIKTETAAGGEFVSLTHGSVLIGAPLYTKVYALFAQRGDRQMPYAVIAEAYHPEHFPPAHEEFSEEPSLQQAADRALMILRATIDQEQIKSSPAA
jgi:hypothetical protein